LHATQIRQKDSIFYFGSYRAGDLLSRVRFISRFFSDDDEIAASRVAEGDEIAQFIARIEKKDHAFQRTMSRAKIRQLKNFYETAVTQPPIPGTVLLFTHEQLRFQSSGSEGVGYLSEPQSKFLIIDGQHRLAALRFYLEEHPEDAATVNVPCMIFDGRSEDFAAEMFVIINSTPTRINKSHLVDLYERVSWAAPDRKFASRLVASLYGEADSPLRYRINRLGGRSQKDKWILQAELFNELYRWVKRDWRRIQNAGAGTRLADDYYATVRDFLKAAERVWGDAWGQPSHMLVRPVVLKALIRVCADLAREDAEPESARVARWTERLSPWKDNLPAFRVQGFYERFPAKGEVERVSRIHRELLRIAKIEPAKSK
jgi:DGQHR domain-containing protein